VVLTEPPAGHHDIVVSVSSFTEEDVSKIVSLFGTRPRHKNKYFAELVARKKGGAR
jgi:hypothetical protein